MKERYITITGFKHYYGLTPFAIGRLVKCVKEPENAYDSEAIKAVMPMIGKVGYVANSPDTAANGTMSAGRIYDHVKKYFYVRVMFTTFTKVICKIEYGNPEEFDREMKDAARKSFDDDWDDEDERIYSNEEDIQF
jgi:hypothetical protein